MRQFLVGLDMDQFGTVRSNLLAMEPLPSLNKVYAAILREERPQSLTRDGEQVHGGSISVGNEPI